MKKILCALLALIMCFGMCAMLASCSDDDTTQDGTDKPDNSDVTPDQGGTTPDQGGNAGETVTYTVSVVDYLGNAVSGIIVEATTASGPVMRPTLVDGKATFQLPSGTYAFTLTSPTIQYQYNKELCQFTPEKKDVTITVYTATSSQYQMISAVPYGTEVDEDDLFGPPQSEYKAYYVNGGATWVELTPGDITYFIYTAEAVGTYRFAMTGAEDASVGYYGNPNFVQMNSLVDIVDGTIEIEIREQHLAQGEGVATIYVIGVYSPTATTGVLNITRKGDNVYIPEVDEPWVDYVAPESAIREYIVHDINDQVAPLTNIDVTDPNFKVVYSESDGYYHVGTEDGPVVMMYLTVASPYLAALTEVAGSALIGKIFYDEDGNFVKKEAYNAIFAQYVGKEDINGCVPLDKYLAHALQNRGDYCGWWDADKMMYLFGEAEIYVPNAWLFACAYYDSIEENVYGTEENPAHITLSHVNYGKGYVTLTPDTTMHIQADLDMKVTIMVSEGTCTVVYNGVTYPVNNGKVVVEIDSTIGSVFTITVTDVDTPVRYTLLIENA